MDGYWKGLSIVSDSSASALHLKSFQFKLMNRLLPTMSRMNKMYPLLYTEAVCPYCADAVEDDIHVFSVCPKSLELHQQLWNDVYDLCSRVIDLYPSYSNR